MEPVRLYPELLIDQRGRIDMGYYVRLLSPASQIIYFSEIKAEVDTVALKAGSDHEWEEIEISGPSEIPIANLYRIKADSSQGIETMARLKKDLAEALPENARQWVLNYIAKVKTIYAFRLLTENLSSDLEWRTLGVVQNLHKDNLGGIIQSDHEGYFNEKGDYIVWQMYSGATGSVPAAALDEKGEWVPFQLKLADEKAVERFKKGERPPKGFYEVFFGKRQP